MNEPTTTSESLGKDIKHTTSRDQKTTGVVPDGENDKSFAIKLAIYLSASSLAISLASPMLLLGPEWCCSVHVRERLKTN